MMDAIFVACYVLSRLWLWERDVFRIEFWHALLLSGKSSSSQCAYTNDESCTDATVSKDPLDATSAHTSSSRRSFRHRHRSDCRPCMKRRSERRSASPSSLSASLTSCPATRSSLPPSLMGCRNAIATCLYEQRHSFHACGNGSSSSSSSPSRSRSSHLRTSSARSIEQPFFPSFKLEKEQDM
jgi:hypothetical protein